MDIEKIKKIKEQFKIVDHENDRLEDIDIQKDLELKKKDKQIDLMCEQLAGLAIFDVKADETIILMDKEEVKQYFEKEVSEDESNY